MHYSATAFARERGLITIEPRPKRDVKFGQREHLSAGDIQQARAMYSCEDTEFIATPVSTTLTQTTQTLATTQQTQVTEVNDLQKQCFGIVGRMYYSIWVVYCPKRTFRV